MKSPFTPIHAIQDEQREGWVAESKPLEAQLADKDAQIAQLQSERENWRVSSVCRDMKAERDEAHAQILALLAELQGIKTYMRSDPITRPCDGNAQVINRIERVLSTPPPPVVPLEDVKPLVDAVRRLENANSRRDKDLAYGRLTEAKDCLSAKHPSLA